MGKQSQRAKPPRDGDDAARATSTRAEDAFELLADTVAAAVDAVELAAHAGGLFFGLGLVAAHAAARRGLWAAACAWCVCNWTFSGRRPARAAAAAALAAALSVAESDNLILASPAETEVVWLLRHALAPAVVGCVGAHSVVALGRASGVALATGGAPQSREITNAAHLHRDLEHAQQLVARARTALGKVARHPNTLKPNCVDL